MKTSSLHEFWSAPDNTRLTSKQFSFRLPVHVAAKIAALCDMYPQKTRTQIVADLLTTALHELEVSMPDGLGERVEDQYQAEIAEQIGEEGEVLYYLGGTRGRFRNLANQHYWDMEKEMGTENPDKLFTSMVLTESQVKK